MNIEMRSLDFKMTNLLQAALNREILQSVDHMQDTVSRIRVTLRDLNGPKGGEDKFCSFRITTTYNQTLIVSGTGSDMYQVIAEVGRRVKSVLGRRKDRWQTRLRRAA